MIARWIFVGLVLWAALGAAFWFLASSFSGDTITWFFVGGILAVFLLTFLLLNILRVDPSDRAEAASIMAVPGLIAGTFLIQNPHVVFQTLSADEQTTRELFALLFACFAAMIICGIVSSRLQSIEKSGATTPH